MPLGGKAQEGYTERYPYRVPAIGLDTYIRLIEYHEQQHGSHTVVIPIAYKKSLQDHFSDLYFEWREMGSIGYSKFKLCKKTKHQGAE